MKRLLIRSDLLLRKVFLFETILDGEQEANHLSKSIEKDETDQPAENHVQDGRRGHAGGWILACHPKPHQPNHHEEKNKPSQNFEADREAFQQSERFTHRFRLAPFAVFFRAMDQAETAFAFTEARYRLMYSRM